jgi:hypothetical protein
MVCVVVAAVMMLMTTAPHMAHMQHGQHLPLPIPGQHWLRPFQLRCTPPWCLCLMELQQQYPCTQQQQQQYPCTQQQQVQQQQIQQQQQQQECVSSRTIMGTAAVPL